jgi:hypothetical protein
LRRNSRCEHFGLRYRKLDEDGRIAVFVLFTKSKENEMDEHIPCLEEIHTTPSSNISREKRS